MDNHACGCTYGFAVDVYFDSFLYGCAWVRPQWVGALAQSHWKKPLVAFAYKG